jgi:hypothetical protein
LRHGSTFLAVAASAIEPNETPHGDAATALYYGGKRETGAKARMKIRNRHERIVSAPRERIAALLADLDRVWPTRIAPAPRPQGHRLYDAGLMLWEEFDRPGAVRAFRVVRPEELQAEHWFELDGADGATVVRHIIDGIAAGTYEAIWSERIEPLHDLVLEALLDNVQAAAGA